MLHRSIKPTRISSIFYQQISGYFHYCRGQHVRCGYSPPHPFPCSKISSYRDSTVTEVSGRILAITEDYVRKCANDSTSLILENLKTKLESNLQYVPQQQPDSPIAEEPVFANNYVNFENIEVIGFDLDYTLVTYTVELQRLIYNLARDLLISSYGIPETLRRLEFDSSFAIRGLCVDRTNAVICKMSHLQRIGHRFAFRGRKRLTAEQIEDFYGEFRTISTGYRAQMKPLNDMFAMAEACLISDVTYILDQKKDSYGEEYSAEAVVEDVLAAIREVHMSGAMHSAVMEDPVRYIKPSPHLFAMLTRFQKAGKQLFLCTNSGVAYAECAMNFVLGNHTDNWRSLFDVIICSANKPTEFYYGKKPFRKWVDEAGAPSPVPISTTLEPGQVYINGSVRALRRATGWASRKVLYVGDNLFADLTDARRYHGWQTACVLEELTEEIAITNTQRFQQLYGLRVIARNLINEVQNHMQDRCELSGATHGNRFPPADDRLVVAELEKQLQHINHAMSATFNKQFGSAFRTDGSPSMFAFSVKRFVDLYMDNACNLRHYSPYHRFFPSHAIHMAHDPAP